MLEKFTYTNHVNERLDFGGGYLFVNENDLRDFVWDISTKNNKITGFKKGIVSKTIPIIINCNSESEGVRVRNNLFEICEKDVLAQKYGKLQIGSYYLRCYITGSKKSQYLIHKSHMVVSLTVQTDLPDWVKETTTTYVMGSAGSGEFLDYSYDYPYDFKNDANRTTIINNNFVPSNFVLTIFGQVANPTLYLGDHEYSVNITVGTNEYLTIDSTNKTIILTKSNGERVNCFDKRGRSSYIFEKIPVGTNVVSSTNPNLRFNLTLFDERSEPKWT